MINKPSKRLMLMQIFVIFILPVLLLYFQIIPYSWRIFILALSSLFIYGIIKRENWSHEEMGIRYDNFKKAFPYYFFFTILGVLTLLLLERRVNMPDLDTTSFFIKTFIFFLPISFFQEFVFRSFLMPRLKDIFKNNFTVIFINALLFTFIHIIYPSLGIILPIVFISGILFAWLYQKFPNLILISISHSILNVTAILLGFFYLN